MSEPSEIVVRQAAPGDQDALGALAEMLVALHHKFDPARFIPAGPNTKAGYGRYLVSTLGRKETIVLVAEEQGAVVGYVYAGIEGNDWMALRGPAGVIYDIIVDPARRQGGIGRQLLNAALEALIARGAPMVVLSTATPNETAQRLFAAAGFRSTMLEMTRNNPAPPEQ